MRNIFAVCMLLALASSCKSPEARRPVTQKSGSYIDEAVARNKKIVAAQEERILQIIERDSLNTYISSPNGFWYFYQEKDSLLGYRPQFGDQVIFEYDLRTLDGRSIYSEEELPVRTYTMDQEKLFGGLREGLKLMQEGETVTFLFPSHKAFGFYGDKNKIGRDVPLMSTVTLLEINKKEDNSNNQ